MVAVRLGRVIQAEVNEVETCLTGWQYMDQKCLTLLRHQRVVYFINLATKACKSVGARFKLSTCSRMSSARNFCRLRSARFLMDRFDVAPEISVTNRRSVEPVTSIPSQDISVFLPLIFFPECLLWQKHYQRQTAGTSPILGKLAIGSEVGKNRIRGRALPANDRAAPASGCQQVETDRTGNQRTDRAQMIPPGPAIEIIRPGFR